MKMRIVWFASGLVASAVLLASGAAFSTNPPPPAPATTTVNQLVDYVRNTGELWGVPQVGGGNAKVYLHDATTVHLPGPVPVLPGPVYYPPDPCIPIGEMWNRTVQFDDRHHTTSPVVYDVLLSLMADFQCSATITATSGTPQPIVSIAPNVK
jgi:hypothetical protein